ncbi:GlcG/HbpS family heme-binding protein [Oceanobacillus senegalensis]|uniref:GlcG/HbpS family heme-binding protein n=1 Tax=Oceanobacillus senegalensis TaxID=1936063 RepID=UPI000A311FA2|nr:heme-binding protein [Oceanobacillus senegalensis]
MSKLNLEVAKKLIEGAEQESKKLGVNMVISVLDEGGNLIAVHRMDDAWLASVEIAQNKAWTSVALKMPTSNLADATVPKAELYGLNTTNSGRLVVFGGGIPLKQDGKVVGAVGVSGSSVEHDVQVAQAAVNVFESLNVGAGR